MNFKKKLHTCEITNKDFLQKKLELLGDTGMRYDHFSLFHPNRSLWVLFQIGVKLLYHNTPKDIVYQKRYMIGYSLGGFLDDFHSLLFI